jgi:hypothetical protein
MTTIHGSLIDYKFRVKNFRVESAVSSGSSAVIHRDGDTFLENGILVELKYVEITAEDSPDSVKRKRTKQGS